jgi:aspartyl/asparaginyl beta-hydroxylase (cupin superfamily)
MPEHLLDAPSVAAPRLDEPVADARLAANRFDMTALVAKADHRFLAGDHRGAAAFYAFAVKTAGREPSASPEEVRHASEMRDWLGARFRHHILAGLETGGFAENDWPARFRAAVQIMFGERQRDLVYERYPQLPQLFFYPGLPYVDFADTSAFAWRDGLESCFAAIRDEAAALLRDTADFAPYVARSPDRPHGDVHGLLENPDWSSLYLWTNGAPVDANVARCPLMFEAVSEHVPLCHIGRRAPAVLLSLLKPGAHIPPHSGMLNVRYICHLPLIVPPGCWFRVGERRVEWQEGRLLAFDDTVEHEARNGGGEDRLVLIFDVWNPHLSEDERLLVRSMLEIVDEYR